MQNLILSALLVLVNSCTTSKTTAVRLPSSIAGQSVVKLAPGQLTDDVSGEDFFAFMKDAQASGVKKIVVEEDRRFKKVSMTEQTSIAGDFYFLVGTNFSDTDESIRSNDYHAMYGAVKRLSWAKFRVTINLVASVQDLKNALANKAPTMIAWVSHGNEKGFYDFNSVRIPADILKDASPSVYQFHLTSCHGTQAYQNVYGKHKPATMQFWSWNRLVYHSSDLEAHFLKGDWKIFDNYPGTLRHNELECRKVDSTFQIAYKDQIIPNSSFDSLETCNYYVANSGPNLVCLKDGKEIGIYNLTNSTLMPGMGFDASYDCMSRISNTRRNKVCRRLAKDNLFHYIDATTNEVSEKAFERLNECYDFVQTLNEA